MNPNYNPISDFNSMPVNYATVEFRKFGNTTDNSPYDQGLTSFGAGMLIRYISSANYGAILAFNSGDTNLYIKSLNNQIFSDWVSFYNSRQIEIGAGRCAVGGLATITFTHNYNKNPFVITQVYGTNPELAFTTKVSNLSTTGCDVLILQIDGESVVGATIEREFWYCVIANLN